MTPLRTTTVKNSSYIKMIAWGVDGDETGILVETDEGEKLFFPEQPPSLYDDFIAASSKGRFFREKFAELNYRKI